MNQFQQTTFTMNGMREENARGENKKANGEKEKRPQGFSKIPTGVFPFPYRRFMIRQRLLRLTAGRSSRLRFPAGNPSL